MSAPISGIADRLAGALAEIRAQAVASAPKRWPAQRELLGSWLPQPSDPQLVLPLATAVGVGAALDAAVPFATVWALICFSVRVLDDCADQDNPRALHLSIGLPRAFNLGTAGLLHAGAELGRLVGEPHRVADVLGRYLDVGVQACAGQDRDITAPPASLQDYLALVEDKTACAFSFAAWGGARLHTDHEPALRAAAACGRHVGIMLQVLDDLEAAWFPIGLSDLRQGKCTLPMFFGLAQVDHPAHRELTALLGAGVPWANERRVLEILDEMNVRRRLVWAAVKERDLARAAIAELPNPDGAQLLGVFLDWTFRDVEPMLTRPRQDAG
jgi:geranylgeranyl pyrophosphate synthase